MASHNWILKCEQYTAHRANKINRRDSLKEIEFGLEIYFETYFEENYGFIWNEFYYEELVNPIFEYFLKGED